MRQQTTKIDTMHPYEGISLAFVIFVIQMCKITN